MPRKPANLLFFGIDSLRRDHMSAYGYGRRTTPHIEHLAAGGALFEQHFSPSIPTTPAYAGMLTGQDCFGTDVVALRHPGPLGGHVRTLAEVLGDKGYNTTCVGFTGNPSSRGFQKYVDYSGWGPDETGRSPKAENLNRVAIPELQRLAREENPFFLFLRHMDPTRRTSRRGRSSASSTAGTSSTRATARWSPCMPSSPSATISAPGSPRAARTTATWTRSTTAP